MGRQEILVCGEMESISTTSVGLILRLWSVVSGVTSLARPRQPTCVCVCVCRDSRPHGGEPLAQTASLGAPQMWPPASPQNEGPGLGNVFAGQGGCGVLAGPSA